MRPLHSNKTNIPLFVLDRSAEEIPIFSYLDELTNMPRPDECLFTRRNQEATLRPFFFFFFTEGMYFNSLQRDESRLFCLTQSEIFLSFSSFFHSSWALSLSLSLSHGSVSQPDLFLSLSQGSFFLSVKVLSLTSGFVSHSVRALFHSELFFSLSESHFSH